MFTLRFVILFEFINTLCCEIMHLLFQRGDGPLETKMTETKAPDAQLKSIIRIDYDRF
jgi:hypothetical protein